jgi:type III secretory pathway component EscV
MQYSVTSALILTVNIFMGFPALLHLLKTVTVAQTATRKLQYKSDPCNHAAYTTRLNGGH